MLHPISKRAPWQWIILLLTAASFSMLSLILLIRTEEAYVLPTAVLSFFFSGWFLHKTAEKTFSRLTEKPLLIIPAGGGSVILLCAMQQAAEAAKRSFSPWLILAALPAVLWLAVFLLDRGSVFLTELWQQTDPLTRRLYLIATAVLSGLVLLLYLTNASWYTQFDKVYSIDSGFCTKSIFPKLYYYDIRHPVMSVFTFPIHAILRTLTEWIAPAGLADALTAVFLQLINLQFLLLSGLIMTRLAGSRHLFPMWLVSLPFLLFSAFFEKYQICIFFLLLYASCLCGKKQRGEGALIASAAAMPTGIFLFADELFIREKPLKKLLRLLRTFAAGVMFLVCSGRIHLLIPHILLDEVKTMAERFGLKSLSIGECLNSFTNMVQGAFLGISSEIGNGKYLWIDVLGKLSLLGVLITAVMAVGIVVGRKQHFLRICTVWTAAALVLFVGVQWSVHASPLFSVYFAWAFLPLFQKGLQWGIERLKLKESVVYGVVFSVMGVINLATMIDIARFLK